ncbi:MAG TPA: type VI secretion system tube protein Hcp [Acidobacteriaceae bacterium]
MAVDYFLKLDPVKGESKADGFVDQIQVLSWSWGGSNVSSVSGSGGSGAGKADLSDLSIMITMDKASPELFKGMTTGTHYKEGLMSAVKTGAKGKPYLTVKMSEVFVTNLSLSASSEVPTASVSFTYKSIEIEYKQQGTDGTLTSTGAVKYDLTTNVSA